MRSRVVAVTVVAATTTSSTGRDLKMTIRRHGSHRRPHLSRLEVVLLGNEVGCGVHIPPTYKVEVADH